VILLAVIEFINNINNSLVGMKRAINYIINENKTKPHLVTGINCSPNINAYFEMLAIKQNYRKTTGRQFIHFTQSFSPKDDLTHEIAHEIAKKLCTLKQFDGFQILTATHIDRDHVHNHFIINTVNADTGQKWKQSPNRLRQLKDYSDLLCQEYGLMVIPKMSSGHENSGEYRSRKNSRSWKYELYLAVCECIKCSGSKAEFIGSMEQLGYKVFWADDRKYITFTTPEGKKCRNKKLYPPERFTKEALIKAFEFNKQYVNFQRHQAKMELILGFVKFIERDNYQKHRYPLSYLEGQALKEKIIEDKNGSELDWNKGEGFEQ
jgi:hypothetical protein